MIDFRYHSASDIYAGVARPPVTDQAVDVL